MTVEAALRDLRPVPRFGSFLGKVMAEHVELMRSLDYRYDVNEGMLLRFDRFLQSRAELAGKLLELKKEGSIYCPLAIFVNCWKRCRPIGSGGLRTGSGRVWLQCRSINCARRSR